MTVPIPPSLHGIASFEDVFKRLIHSPAFDVLSSSNANSSLETLRPTIIHIYRK